MSHSARELSGEERIQLFSEQRHDDSEPLDSYDFTWFWHTIFPEPEEASLAIGRREVTEVFLLSRKADSDLHDECCLLFLKWFDRWRKTKAGKRKFKGRLKELEGQSPKKKLEILDVYLSKDLMLSDKFEMLYEEHMLKKRKRLARLSLDSSLSDFQYLSPPVTCTSEGIDSWATAICSPFSERLEWDEVDWAGKVLQEVGHLGRMIQAPTFEKDEILQRINKLDRLTPPGRLESDAELRLFKWTVESFRRSLVGYLMSTHDLRKCGHRYCQFGPYFFPSRSWQKYCTDTCQDNAAGTRYYEKKKKKAR